MILFLAFFLCLGGFIYGMFLLRSSLFSFSIVALKKWQTKLIDTPWKSLLLGLLITMISQNIFAVLIITGRFVTTRLLTFQQAIGIILGAYIGKTITTEMITIHLQPAIIISLVTIGAVLSLIKIKHSENIGYGLIGLSLIFGGMWGFKKITPLIINLDFLMNLFVHLDQSNLHAVLAGTVFTAISQSTTATTGVVMSLLAMDVLHLATGIAVILGANISTCIIMLLTTIRSKIESKLTVLAYTWLTIVSIVIIFPLIHVFSSLGVNLSSTPETQLAHIIVIYHILVSLIVLPFIKPFEAFLLTIHNYKTGK